MLPESVFSLKKLSFSLTLPISTLSGKLLRKIVFSEMLNAKVQASNAANTFNSAAALRLCCPDVKVVVVSGGVIVVSGGVIVVSGGVVVGSGGVVVVSGGMIVVSGGVVVVSGGVVVVSA